MTTRDESDRSQPGPAGELEGEGNKTADRKYREGLAEFARTHDVERLAEQAREDVEHDPREFEEARRESLEHVAEEDPEIAGPLARRGPPPAKPLEPEQERGADLRDTRAGIAPPPEVRRDEARREDERREAA